MMKKICLFLCSSASFAALPPLAQSTKELQAVLADARFYQSLGSAEIIEDIIRIEEGFLVLTQHYAMKVEVKYIEGSRRIGPKEFELEFQQPVDLETGRIKDF